MHFIAFMCSRGSPSPKRTVRYAPRNFRDLLSDERINRQARTHPNPNALARGER